MKTLMILGVAFFAYSAPALAQYQYPFQDPALDAEKRIDNVLSLMTLDEKIASLGTSGVMVPRLGIRGTAIGEALSGVVLGGPMQTLIDAFPGAPQSARTLPTRTTQFPQGVGLARTWDPDLVRRAGAVIGSEARYIFENGENAKAFLVLLTPNADLARDPRWGRTEECYGEDPFFNGTMAAALIHGHSGRRPEVLAGRLAAEALPRQQQREWPLRLVVGFRRAAVPRVLLGAVPHGIRGRRRARVDGVLQRLEPRADDRPPDSQERRR